MKASQIHQNIHLYIILILSILSSCIKQDSADKLFNSENLQPTDTNAPVPVPTGPTRPMLVAAGSNSAFGTVTVGESSPVVVSLINAGTEPAQDVILTSSNPAFVISNDGCTGLPLLNGASCLFTLTFTPGITGPVSTVLKASYEAASGESFVLDLAWSGTGQAVLPKFAASPASWDFGSVATGNFSTKAIIVSNTTSASALTGAASVTGNGYSVSSDGCNSQVLASGGGSCTITVNFSPSVPGSSLGILTVPYSSGGSNYSLSVNLSAIGDVPQPALTISPNPHNFASVATNAHVNQTFTISNNTSVSATIGVANVSGVGFTIIASSCNSIVLGAAASCTVTVRFAPSSLGVVSGSLIVPYTSTQAISYTSTVTLGGTGVAPAVTFTFNGFTGNPNTDTTNLTATGIRLQWSAQTQASYYRITRTGGSGGTVVSSNIFPTTTSIFDVTGLSPGTVYQFKINAFDSNGTSDGNENWVSITTPNVTGATFNGWTDVVATGQVFTDIGAVDTALGYTGNNRLERNITYVAGFESAEINTATEEIITNRDFATGQKLVFRTDALAPAPLLHGGTYYAIRVSSTVTKLASSLSNAFGGIAIDLTSTGSGNMTLMEGPVVKLAWEPFTFTPTASASSYNVYRSSTSGSGFSFIGSTNTNIYYDYSVNAQSKYYYYVHPAISGSEVIAASAPDTELEVYVPAQNMALMHRWMVNRETCTTLLGFSTADLRRNDHYSCPYTWGGGYAPAVPNALKSKWDIGYHLAMDRFKNGCKMTPTGPIVGGNTPTGGSVGDVYYRRHATDPTSGQFFGSFCYYRTSASWTPYSEAGLTEAELRGMTTNFPGYPALKTRQDNAYLTCQQSTDSNLRDGNGNPYKLRLMRIHELIAARGFQGTYINNPTGGTLISIVSGSNLPLNGSCNVSGSSGIASGVSISPVHPALFPYSRSNLINGAFLTRNCRTRYEIHDLWGQAFEWTSEQATSSGTGTGYFVVSSLDPGAKLLENYLLDGVMGPASGTLFGGTNSIPMLGVSAVSVSSSLGSRATPATINGASGIGPNTGLNSGFRGIVGGNGTINGSFGRYQMTTMDATTNTPADGTYNNIGVTFRCVGEVIP